jgi:hypothetical protein
MVWSQYIEDGNYDLDVDLDENGEIIEDEDAHMTIHDWEVKYSDELWEMWDMLKQLLCDAFLERTLLENANFTEFAAFCYTDHVEEPRYLYFPSMPHLRYIWMKLLQYVKDVKLQDVILRNATFDHFVDFVAEFTPQNNMRLY